MRPLSFLFPYPLPLAPLLAGSLLLITPLPLRADVLHCGDVLTGRGATFVLETDLTCPSPGPGSHAVGLVLDGGATLDMNGHTLTCAAELERGIVMNDAQVRNGTIAGCRTGLLIERGGVVVEHMVLTGNGRGVHVKGAQHNTFIGNTASQNVEGFLVEDGVDNVLLDNTATMNYFGLGVLRGANNLVMGNTATANGAGFGVSSQDSQLIGNRAEANLLEGFGVGDGPRIDCLNNTAVHNQRDGFAISEGRYIRVRSNLALENGKDGFHIHRQGRALLELSDNRAFANGEHGIHVDAGTSLPRTVIRGNTAEGHVAPYFDLADDPPRCRGTLWRANTFDTKSQACIK